MLLLWLQGTEMPVVADGALNHSQSHGISGTLLCNEASLLFVSPSSASVYSPEGLSIRLSAKKSKTFGKGRLGNKGKHRKPETNANNIAKLQHRAVSICHFTCFALGYLSLWKPEITHLWYDPSARRTHILGTHTHTHSLRMTSRPAVRPAQCFLLSPSPAFYYHSQLYETKRNTGPHLGWGPFIPGSPAALKPRFRRFVLNQTEGTVIKG